MNQILTGDIEMYIKKLVFQEFGREPEGNISALPSLQPDSNSASGGKDEEADAKDRQTQGEFR